MRTGCGSRADARFDGNRDDKSMYCRDNILLIVVCVRIPDNSPGRFSPVMPVATPVGKLNTPDEGVRPVGRGAGM